MAASSPPVPATHPGGRPAPARESAPGSCAVCGADRQEPLCVQRGYRFVRCASCGLVSLTPRPAPAALLAAYADYHARDGGTQASWDRLMRDVFEESAALLDVAGQPQGSPAPRLLDVGCGFGGFVELMRERGWEAEGLEPSPAAVETARARGRPVRPGTLEAFEGRPGGYEAVTLFYVLEHLADPLAALRKVRTLLAPGGRVVIRVPDTTPIVRLLRPLGLGDWLYDAPFHLFDFSPPTLRVLLGRTGFTDVRIFPGRPTLPARLSARLTGRAWGALARGLYAGSGGRLLLPAASKTAIARKPPR